MRMLTTVLGQATVFSQAIALNMVCIFILGTSVHAQINIGELNPANAYDTGVLQPGAGGLDSTLWQGTTAARAAKLINETDTNATNPNANSAARDLILAALLSGGVPPRSDDSLEHEAYRKAQLSTVLELGDLAAFDQLVSGAGISQNNPAFTKIFVVRALLGDDTHTACALGDTHSIERKAPYWAKLRAFCHVVRSEIPAAELTADLLSRSGHEDKIFFDMLGKLTGSRPKIKIANVTTPLHIAMLGEVRKTDSLDIKNLPTILSARTALDIKQPANDRLAALISSAHILGTEQIRSVLGGLAASPLEDTQSLSGENTWDAQQWGEVYLALVAGNDINISATLASALLVQADKSGVLLPIAAALEAQTSFIPTELLATNNAKIYARLAVSQRDTGALRSLFVTLEESDPLRARIALASDALGGGFLLGELGVDIETRLKDKAVRARAVRDTYIAVALGANLSDTAMGVLFLTKLKGAAVNPGDLLSLHETSRRGAKAELALRLAKIFSEIPPGQMRADSFAAILSAMTNAGMNGMAEQLAAQDLLNYD